MPSGLGPYYDCSDLGVAVSIDDAERSRKDYSKQLYQRQIAAQRIRDSIKRREESRKAWDLSEYTF
jgi:hypothetical protein